MDSKKSEGIWGRRGEAGKAAGPLKIIAHVIRRSTRAALMRSRMPRPANGASNPGGISNLHQCNARSETQRNDIEAHG
ncbi:uncharacterized protein N7469_005732 [Penicillium citrinum]|uniref:Uncharacterized protein n=2 Tax=Penicillium TaxID=5073 RepID=A0A9W9P292_PENCI|nr:uncharacterized protein N7469_005732 [Penicillium citrinum]KAJ5233966.1 hypothetical protein N7469_005732 [Penicillium citrinum]KAJ5572551.1 hypothetical protein N7450_009535 [Penicillium hetheringtonii]